MKLTWYGTAGLGITSGETSLLFDPFIPLRGSKVRIQAQDFDGYPTVVATHAHFDHIGSLPTLCAREPRQIYGTPAVHQALQKMGLQASLLHPVEVGKPLNFGDITVTPYQGRHVVYGFKTLFKTFAHPRMFRYAYSWRDLSRANKICEEQGQTMGYLVEAEGKSLFIMGSLNLDDNTVYPTGMDVLVVPYQGCSDLCATSLAIIQKLQPKAVLLDHCDDTFPPLSRKVDTRDIKKALCGKMPIYELKACEALCV